MAQIKIDRSLCTGCGLCLTSCPFGALQSDDEGKTFVTDACTLCRSCLDECPFGAISLSNDTVEADGDNMLSDGIWVFAEHKDGQLRQVVAELLAKARQLAACLDNTCVTALLPGGEPAKLAPLLIGHGADRVICLPLGVGGENNEAATVAAVAAAVKKYQPEILLVGATAFGRSLAPRLASRLQTGLTADCTALAVDAESGLLHQTRPAFGGNLMATIICPKQRPQMATVRPHVFKPSPFDRQRSGEVLSESPPEALHTAVRLLRSHKNPSGEINLGDAEVIVAVGKGIGKPQNIVLAQELAALLGGALGASRPVVDAGWLPYARQVGQTGKTVGPKLYIACGIFGAIQHLAGMSSAETIIAINNDPDAPIFKVAHYGIVADAADFLTELIEKLKN